MTNFWRIETPFSYSWAVVAGNTSYLGLPRVFGENFAAQLRGTFEGLIGTEELGLATANLVKVNVVEEHQGSTGDGEPVS